MLRKLLDTVAVVALLTMWAMTAYALHGPHPLPRMVPTHFDPAGRPNAWGDVRMLWMMPAFAAVAYFVTTLVARFPAAFNYPVRVTPANRARLEAISLQMIAWLKVEMVVLFGWIQYAIIASARQGHGTLSPLVAPLALGVIFLTIGWHVVAIFKAGAPRRRA